MTPTDLEAPTVPAVEDEQAPRWELAECTCPDPCCERDHEQD